MGEFLRKLGMQDDENYIYLDKDGNAQKRIELAIYWQQLPSKRILLTCRSHDSLSYLRSKIGDSMEKYKIFSGLSNLQATTIINNKINLPESGLIGDFCTSGDQLACELTSSDLWLHIRIHAKEIRIVIFAEIKVFIQKTIYILKKAILDIANQVFKVKGFKNIYEEPDLELKKIKSIGIDVFGEDFALTQGDSSNESLLQIDDDDNILNCFSFLDQLVHVEICKKKEEDLLVSMFSTHNLNIYESISHISATIPVRNLRIEPLLQSKKQSKKSPTASKPYSSRLSSHQCSCIKCVIV